MQNIKICEINFVKTEESLCMMVNVLRTCTVRFKTSLSDASLTPPLSQSTRSVLFQGESKKIIKNSCVDAFASATERPLTPSFLDLVFDVSSFSFHVCKIYSSWRFFPMKNMRISSLGFPTAQVFRYTKRRHLLVVSAAAGSKLVLSDPPSNDSSPLSSPTTII